MNHKIPIYNFIPFQFKEQKIEKITTKGEIVIHWNEVLKIFDINILIRFGKINSLINANKMLKRTNV